MAKWEYCIEFVGKPTGLLSEQKLAEMGQDGWELAAVHTYMYHSRTFGKALETAWIFKRPKQDEGSEPVMCECGCIMEPCRNAYWCRCCGAWRERDRDGDLDLTEQTKRKADGGVAARCPDGSVVYLG